jgi:alkylation response protein AidB-like acyl-CoA dehydrogenase
MLSNANRFAYNEDHDAFRDTVRKVFAEHMEPFLDQHEKEGIVPRSAWKALGDAGMLCPTVAEENGGLGLDFGFNCVLCEELSYMGSAAGFTLQSDITANYFERLGSDEQRAKYLPSMVSGDIITAIAMTEPGTGSDLQGIKTTAKADGNHLVINGSKTYITNGQNADCVIVVAKTDPSMGAKGTSLILVDADTPGFERGRNLDKIGQHSADTSELFFNDVRVPKTNILGTEGRGFIHLMEELP